MAGSPKKRARRAVKDKQETDKLTRKGMCPPELQAEASGWVNHVPLSKDERRTMLVAIGDLSLTWWHRQVESMEGRGTLAARESYKGALEEIAALDGGTEGATKTVIEIAGVDLSLIETSPRADDSNTES
jgi:hypothetical protein